MIARALLPAILLSLAMPAPAFALYKCEAGGKVSYGDAPCDGGRIIDVPPKPATENAAMRHQLLQQKAELKRLENARHKQEAQQDKLRRTAVRAGTAQQKKCATLERRKKWADEDAAKAAGKSAEKARRKARRAEETYQAECGSQ